MRKMTADFILGPDGHLHSQFTLVVDENGNILDLTPSKLDDAEHFNGIISPGFINTHCHLELSHLKGIVPKHKGLHGFITDFVKARETHTPTLETDIQNADQQMWNNGIVAVADICNSPDSFTVKKKSLIQYHSFIELFDLKEDRFETVFQQGLQLYEEALALKLQASLTPHAPYSVSASLFNKIKTHCETNHLPWSLHNLESSAEDEMFKSESGELFELMKKAGAANSNLVKLPEHSLAFSLPFAPINSNILLVHNTYLNAKHLSYIQHSEIKNNVWMALCPNANLYIENKLPDINLLRKHSCKITIGTDSLASNNQLSILEELKTISNAFPEIETAELLTWATRNGAEFLNLPHLGTLKPGTKPGILLIQNTSPKSISLSDDTKVVRIF